MEMRKWLFGFLGVALIVFCSVFGYVSYQKHEGDVFKQNIEKKMPVDQINAHAKSYKEDATNVNNDMSLGQMLSIQQEAIEMGVNKQVFAQIFVDPSITDKKERFKAATNFILKNENKLERVENLHFETEKYKDHPIDYQPLTEKGRSYLKEERKLPDWLIDYAEKEGLIAELFIRRIVGM